MKLTPQRRADEFARLVATGIRPNDPVTAPMLTVVDALAQVPAAAGPRPEFRAALRQRLVAVAAVQAAAPVADSPLDRVRSATGTWRVQRRLVAMGAGAAVVTAVAGVSVGASRSLPGEPFYGVKRAAEGVQLATTTGTEDRGKRHLEFARTRLAELKALTEQGSALGPVGRGHVYAADAATGAHTEQLILDTLRDMDVDTRAGANDLFVAFRDSGSTEPLRALNGFTTRQFRELRGLMTALPAGVQPRAASSLSLLNLVASDTVSLVRGTVPSSTPAGTPTPVAPSASAGPTAPATSDPTSSATPTGQRSTDGSAHPSPTSKLPPLPTAPVVPSIPSAPLPTGPAPSTVPTLDLGNLLGH